MRTLIVAILALGLAGCSSLVRQPYDRSIEYRRDIELTIKGLNKAGKTLFESTWDGIAVVPVADLYEIRGEAKGEFDFLLWQTCTGQRNLEREGDSFRIQFAPNAIEKGCGGILEIRGIEEKKRRNTGAIVFFENAERWKLPAKMSCNRDERSFNGTSACHSKTGLLSSIKFEKKTFVRGGSPECELLKTEEGETAPDADFYLFKMPARRCAYVVTEAEEPFRKHLMLLRPYQDITVTREGD